MSVKRWNILGSGSPRTAPKITESTVQRGHWETNKIFAAASHFVRLDILVMNAYDLLVKRDSSGWWRLKALSNGGFYLVPPEGPASVHVASPNGYSADISLDASGMVATLFALSELSLRGSEAANAAFCLLEQYAWQHPEATHIRGIID